MAKYHTGGANKKDLIDDLPNWALTNNKKILKNHEEVFITHHNVIY